MFVEVDYGFELLVAVEAECVIAWGMLIDGGGDGAQALQVSVDVTGDLDFKMAQTVSVDALVERLRQRVVEFFIIWDGVSGQRISQADRVAREHTG